MPFPESERVIYHNNPLGEVICQLRFPTILDITAKSPADFQNEIRADFPIYREEGVQEFPEEISELIERMSISTPKPETIHVFLSEDEIRRISLSSGFVAYSEGNYECWEKFRQGIDSARKALQKTYEPAFYSRVGLRYKDVIDRESIGLDGTPWSELLKEPICGILGAIEVGDQVTENRAETLMNIGDVIGGMARLLCGTTTRADDNRQLYLIDSDFYTKEKVKDGDVSDILGDFNRVAGNFFRWAISEKLRDALEPRSLG